MTAHFQTSSSRAAAAAAAAGEGGARACACARSLNWNAHTCACACAALALALGSLRSRVAVRLCGSDQGSRLGDGWVVAVAVAAAAASPVPLAAPAVPLVVMKRRAAIVIERRKRRSRQLTETLAMARELLVHVERRVAAVVAVRSGCAAPFDVVTSAAYLSIESRIAVRGRLRRQPDATPRGCGYSNERPSERRCPRSAPGARQAHETAPNAVRSSGAVYRLSISFYPVWKLQQ